MNIAKKKIGPVARFMRGHEQACDRTSKIGGAGAVGGAVVSLFTASSIPEVVCVAGLIVFGIGKAGKAIANMKCEHNRRLADCSKCNPIKSKA